MKAGTNGPGYPPMRAATCTPTGLESHATGGAVRKRTRVTFHLGKPVLLARLLFSLVAE